MKLVQESNEEVLLQDNLPLLNPFTPVSDQDRLSPYYIYTISCRQVMRIKKITIMVLLIDLIPNSPNLHNENHLADSKENY